MISLAEQIAEAQRELALRKQCYPAWVKSGKLDAGDATYQIRVMEAMVRTLVWLDAEQRQLCLFSSRDDGFYNIFTIFLRRLYDLPRLVGYAFSVKAGDTWVSGRLQLVSVHRAREAHEASRSTSPPTIRRGPSSIKNLTR